MSPLEFPHSRLPAADLEALAKRYDRPGPRYTSFPTAVQFSEAFGPGDYLERLQAARKARGEPLSAYLHVPFCARRCAYCGCQVIATMKEGVAGDYLDHLELEMALVAKTLGRDRPLSVIHLGGGTPTYLTPEELERLFRMLRERFAVSPAAEVSVELDPRVTGEPHIQTLKTLGVNRVSLGVQDLAPAVQEAIGRRQSAEETALAYHRSREVGFQSVNLDLVYGLPRQTLESFTATLEQVIRLRPDRVAVYGYAHLPWMRSNQASIDERDLPSAPERLQLFLRARELFTEAGYLQVGMDHFALEGDELAAACLAGRLGRNFMGYTPHAALDIIGLGLSSIGRVAGAYVQNQKRLAGYYRMLEAGVLPVARGHRSSPDDEIRRTAIQGLLCNFRLDFERFELDTGVVFQEYFREELEEIQRFVEEGLVERLPEGIRLTALGRCFVRNVAMALDCYNRPRAGEEARFSRTV